MSDSQDIVTLQAHLEASKAHQKELKQQIRAKEANLRAQAKAIKKAEQAGQPSFWDKTCGVLEWYRLKFYEKFEDKAADLRYKREDPEGHEADCVINDIGRIVTHFEKKAEKRDLSDKENEILVRLDTTLHLIQDKQIGHRQHQLPALISCIRNLLPTEVTAAMDAIDQADNPSELFQLAQEMLEQDPGQFITPLDNE